MGSRFLHSESRPRSSFNSYPSSARIHWARAARTSLLNFSGLFDARVTTATRTKHAGRSGRMWRPSPGWSCAMSTPLEESSIFRTEPRTSRSCAPHCEVSWVRRPRYTACRFGTTSRSIPTRASANQNSTPCPPGRAAPRPRQTFNRIELRVEFALVERMTQSMFRENRYGSLRATEAP